MQSVVIVGGGFAGIGLFHRLGRSLDAHTTTITLVTPRAHFVHLPAVLRMLVKADEPDGIEDRVLLPLPVDRFNQGNKKLVIGTVTAIVEGEEDKGRYVVLDNGERIEYTVLALATGCNWEGCLAFPESIPDVRKHDKEWRQRLADAKSVVLVGGGGIGFELAGEIMDDWPDKKVTIVHSKPFLLNDTYSDKWRQEVNENIQKRGVEVVLNDRVTDILPRDGKITTKNGLTLDADLVIPTWGQKPNTNIIGESLGLNTLNSSGQVRVRSTFQLVDFPRIFALGDITDIKEQKSARKTGQHSKITANNIKVILVNGTDVQVSHGFLSRLLSFLKPVLLPYPGCVENLPLSNGRDHGTTWVGIWGGITFGDWFTSRTASRNLMMRGIKWRLKL